MEGPVGSWGGEWDENVRSLAASTATASFL